MNISRIPLAPATSAADSPSGTTIASFAANSIAAIAPSQLWLRLWCEIVHERNERLVLDCLHDLRRLATTLYSYDTRRDLVLAVHVRLRPSRCQMRRGACVVQLHWQAARARAVARLARAQPRTAHDMMVLTGTRMLGQREQRLGATTWRHSDAADQYVNSCGSPLALRLGTMVEFKAWSMGYLSQRHMPVTASAGQAFLGPGPPSVTRQTYRLAPSLVLHLVR